MKYSILFVTCPNLKSADEIAEHLLKLKLIACANIIPISSSKYWWKGKMESHSEVLVIMKTQTKFYKRLEKEIKRIHPYTVPEILLFKINQGNKEYLDWIGM